MYKLPSSLLAVFCFAILTLGIACKKENLPDIPNSFIKRILLEKFAGEWCFACPTAQTQAISLQRRTPDQFTFVSIHRDDWLDHPHEEFLLRGLEVLVMPTGMIDRRLFDNTKLHSHWTWQTYISQTLETSIASDVGLTLESSIDGNNASITVGTAQSGQMDLSTRLHLYVVRNEVPARDQTGHDGFDPYVHLNVLTEVLTPPEGTTNLLFSGVMNNFKYDLDLTNYDPANLSLVAFLSSPTGEILNSRMAGVGEKVEF